MASLADGAASVVTAPVSAAAGAAKAVIGAAAGATGAVVGGMGSVTRGTMEAAKSECRYRVHINSMTLRLSSICHKKSGTR